MNTAEMEALEQWQASSAGSTERCLHDISVAMDDLTTLCQSREGLRIVRANRAELLAVKLKLDDLVMDTANLLIPSGGY